MTNATMFQTSVDTRLLYASLAKVEPGDHISYRDLSATIDRDVTADARSNLSSARRQLEREGSYFDSVRGEGLCRMDDAALVASAEGGMQRTRRLAKRSARRIAAADYDALTNESRIAHNTALSLFGAVAAMASRKAVKKLESQVAAANRELPLARTLAAFGAAGAKAD